MDPTLLERFRQQLATWIEQRLATRRLPFQHLEVCPRLLTECGHTGPDLVLWINPESHLAGSVILLPNKVDDSFLRQGAATAKALGLAHFATWAPREVCVWQIATEETLCIKRFALPSTDSIRAEDFQHILNLLIDELKVISVTTAPASQNLGLYYYANLCLRTLRELTPGLTESARLTAGESADDAWLEDAPRSKGWLSLWRILLLLGRDLFPPGLQPERLEQALHYALADCMIEDQNLAWLAIRDDEPPLPDQEAIRMHLLASRMRQLGWPQTRDHLKDLIELILVEVADRYGIETLERPRCKPGNVLFMNCLPSRPDVSGALMAPRPFLAGQALLSTLLESAGDMEYVEHWRHLDRNHQFAEIRAALRPSGPIRRAERETHMILLRQVWPNRRFEMPKEAPAWLWDALYLAGLSATDMTLQMPESWLKAPGLESLWSVLTEHYQITGLSLDQHDRPLLRWSRSAVIGATLVVHRHNDDNEMTLPWTHYTPGTIRLLSKASEASLAYLKATGMAPVVPDEMAWTKPLQWGTYLFLQSRFGRHLWALCSNDSQVPDLDMIPEAVLDTGVPLPDETSLLDLSCTWPSGSWPPDDWAVFEQEFTNVFGAAPDISSPRDSQVENASPKQRRKKRPIEDIVASVFVDGRPDFPEHYLMGYYRPELVPFALDGPLEITTAFFDRISLQNRETNKTIDVTGRLVAEALVLASWSGTKQVSLPVDEQILTAIIEKYRNDLQDLWHKLVRECRRNEPHRQAALRMARQIWQRMKLPPDIDQ